MIKRLMLLLLFITATSCAESAASNEQVERFTITNAISHTAVSGIDLVKDNVTGRCYMAIRFYSGGGTTTEVTCGDK